MVQGRAVPGLAARVVAVPEGGGAGLSSSRAPAGVYLVRNRVYSPALGRFLQRDPNETALPVVAALAMNGSAAEAEVGPFLMQSHYGDGLSLYAFAGSNPVSGRDPLGLRSLDDEIDDIISDLTGHRLYALGAINEGARWASLGLQTTLDIAGALLGLDVFESVAVLASGRGGFWDAMNIVAAAVPGSGALKAIGKARKIHRLAKGGAHVGKLVGHHTVPVQVLKLLPASVRNDKRLTGRATVWPIPEGLHKELHGATGKGTGHGGAWNLRFRAEVHAQGGYGSMTVERILSIRDQLVIEFDILKYMP
jgi:hypothetical protein